MKKKDIKEYEKWLVKVWEKYRIKLKMERYNPRFVYQKDLNANMECTFRYPYLDNDIKYGDSIIELWKKNKDEALRIAVHEFCHIFTDPLYSKATSRFLHRDEVEDVREELVDYLSNVFVSLIEK